MLLTLLSKTDKIRTKEKEHSLSLSLLLQHLHLLYKFKNYTITWTYFFLLLIEITFYISRPSCKSLQISVSFLVSYFLYQDFSDSLQTPLVVCSLIEFTCPMASSLLKSSSHLSHKVKDRRAPKFWICCLFEWPRVLGTSSFSIP